MLQHEPRHLALKANSQALDFVHFAKLLQKTIAGSQSDLGRLTMLSDMGFWTNSQDVA